MVSSEPASPSARRSNATGRSRQPDGGSQSAEDGVKGGANKPPAPHPSNRQEPAAGRRPAECRGRCSRGRRAPRAPQPCNRPEPAAGLLPAVCRRWCSRGRRAPRAQQPCNWQEPAAERSVGELSKETGLEVREALWSLFFPHLAFFRFAAGKTIGLRVVAHDEKPLKSIVDAAVIARLA
jgi:hypothetical protein